MSSATVKREFYSDKYNSQKSWEIVALRGGFYVRQYINDRQFGRGVRMTKRQISELPLGRPMGVMK